MMREHHVPPAVAGIPVLGGDIPGEPQRAVAGAVEHARQRVLCGGGAGGVRGTGDLQHRLGQPVHGESLHGVSGGG